MSLRLWILPLVSGCVFPPTNVLDCESVALRGSDGIVDPCDDAACGSCVGTCGAGCMLLDADPREYTCADGATWSADDLCQHWYD